MISATLYRCPFDLLDDLVIDEALCPIIFNQPTGNFFTDPWVLKTEYQQTVWEKVLKTLPVDHGEARLIKLGYGTCYHNHSDIDDRYHLNLEGEESYLVDIQNRNMYPITKDGIWYEMDAGKIHSAVNFGRYNRYQIVVRKLLDFKTQHQSITVVIKKKNTISDNTARYVFDNTVSPWLNRANKQGWLQDFVFTNDYVKIICSATCLYSLQERIDQNFMEITVYD